MKFDGLKSRNELNLDDLIDIAKLWGSTAGRFSVDIGFADYAERRLHRLFVEKYGELGVDPEILAGRRKQFETEVERLDAKTTSVLPEKDAYPVRIHPGVCVGVPLACVLIGLVCELMGLNLSRVGWSAFAVFSLLGILLLHALPSGVRYGVVWWRFAARAFRLGRLRKQIRCLAEAEWEQMQLRNQRDQFLQVSKEMLTQIFEFYRCIGRETAEMTLNKVA